MIPIARPVLGEPEADAARRAILSGWVTQGPEVAAFEEEFAAAVGAPHACAVSSCTTALHLALLAAGVAPGDEVVTVSHSFIATANAIRYCGAVPVFVDVELDTFNIDPALVEAALSPRTRALLLVHQLGMPCDLSRLLALAHARSIPVIEDAACAIGSEIVWDGGWQRIGRPHGDLACFSFHPRKLLSTGDGGMIVTANAETDTRLRRLRQHGMSVPDTVRHASAQVVFEDYPTVGFNYRMTDIQAAIGREQLRRLPAIVERRRTLAARYHAALAGHPRVIVPHEPAWARSNWQTYAVRLRGADQRLVMQRMLDDGVATRRGVMNAHLEAAYPPGTWRAAGSLARSEEAQTTAVALPLFHQMTDEEQARVVSSLTCALGG
ncbi:MAG TPA: DegT/DnrJ/EryC1/StrS family aminotransferase [Vicinamibacterales bacterium]|jgi:dTDP-4-amino-4,6-dideoxygalactose transaminase|nr:DegT/DnrJ/EryC1/StrS family aminotransferase [Vicinamibacterales bacterium]